jgi:hypothetical protein
LETSDLPVEDVAVGSVRAAEDDEQRLACLTGSLKGTMVVGQPSRFWTIGFIGTHYGRWEMVCGREKNHDGKELSHGAFSEFQFKSQISAVSSPGQFFRWC